jgi:leucyl aminopeptidase
MKIQLQYARNMEQAVLEADAVVCLLTDDAGIDCDWTGMPQAVREAADKLIAKGLISREAGDTHMIPSLGMLAADHIILAGLGAGSPNAESLRRTGAAIARAAKKLKAGTISVLIGRELAAGTAECRTQQAVQAIAEGLILGYESREARRKDAKEAGTLRVILVPNTEEEGIAAEFEAGIARGRLFGDATAFARRLTNLPGNMLTPEMLAMEAEAMADRTGLEIEVIDEWTAAEQGMGGLLGVGQGSANPPRMIVLHYDGAPESKEKLGLIGKGITFDTGGISLKRAEGMEEMISDMAGAAAVLGAMQIIAELKPAVNVVAVIPAAENMPSGQALKPGDVLTTMSGQTVEVVNTDAEGRLVLADGLTTAIRRGATRLIDVATLTGAVMVALGDVATGAITNEETFLQELILVGRRTGERIWPLPAFPEYRKLIESDAADLKNSGGRHAGTITGGLFIGAFAEELPWIHLDIGGTAWLYKDRHWEPKGATGAMTRTLAEFVLQQQ